MTAKIESQVEECLYNQIAIMRFLASLDLASDQAARDGLAHRLRETEDSLGVSRWTTPVAADVEF